MTREHVKDTLIHKYVYSDVTSGEFIHYACFPLDCDEETLRNGIQDFLDWDESEETFELKKDEHSWYLADWTDLYDRVFYARMEWSTQDFKDAYEDEWDNYDFDNTPTWEMQEKMQDYVRQTYDEALIIDLIETEL